MTLNGIVSIKRTILINEKLVNKNNKQKAVVPLDELLQIHILPFKMTKGTMLEVAYCGQMHSSYEEASNEISKKLGYQISRTLVRKVTVFVGNLVYQKDLNMALETEKNMANSIVYDAEKKDGILYLLTDGAALNTRIEDDNGSTWRENKLAMSFASINVVNRGKNPKNGQMILKKEYISYIGTASEFYKFVYQIAINQGYGKFKECIMISDGATWIRTMCNEIFPDVLQILDKFHLDENIYTFAKYVFKNDETKYKKWSEMIIQLIADRKVRQALKQIKKVTPVKLPASVVNLTTYINNNIDKIDYKTYKEKGYYIGSGAIESGNKTVLQKRLKQAGMRWSVETAQPVLTLRAKYESDLWSTDVKSLVMGYGLH